MQLRDEDQAQKVMREMDNKIARILQHYNWEFSDGRPIGKLSAYFANQA